jgi:hypothetical protein
VLADPASEQALFDYCRAASLTQAYYRESFKPVRIAATII